MVTSDQTAARQQAAEAEMEAIVAAHEQALLRYAGGMLRNPHAAEDAVQHAFIKLCDQGFPIAMDPPALKAWLFRAVHNAAIDQLRQEKRLSALHEKAASDPASDPPAPADPTERRQLVLDCLTQLPASEQQILLLRLQQGLPYKVISQTTGLPSGTVGRMLHDAVRKLGDLVRKAGAS
jgi:RNA polymerase sigma-70 factor (ECF subfamily)